MRVKLVPPPPADRSTLAEAQRAVPLVPRPEGECWPAIAEALALSEPDVARTWLTFLRGVGLVRRGRQGFARTRVEPDRETLAAGLRDGVFLAAELEAALVDEPLSAEAAYGAVADRVPPWERAKTRHWERTWRGRVERLLGWLVLAGLADRTDAGLVRA